MRGNLAATMAEALIVGSIPAYAGEPNPADVQQVAVEVYPRVCGGTFAPSQIGGNPRGLSPRMRGNRRRRIARAVEQGSIPAYAGEPR